TLLLYYPFLFLYVMHIVIDNVILVGTSHIAHESVSEIRNLVTHYQPTGIAVELDSVRAQSLFKPQKSRFTLSFGLSAGIFTFFAGMIQKKLGKMVGLQPGADMKEGIIVAKQHNIPVYLIDQHIYITMKKLNRVVGLRFYFSLIKDVVRGLLGKQPKVALDLKKAPSQELIAVAMEHMKQYYPKLYDVLVEQRNKVMVNRIMHITEKN